MIPLSETEHSIELDEDNLPSWNQAGYGSLRVIELATRKTAFIRQSQIAGVVEIKEGGPSRILFTGGGSIEVCGAVQALRCEIRIAELTERRT